MKTRFLCAGAALLFSAFAWANSTGAPAGSAGVPSEGNCTDCHGGTANSGAGRIRVALVDAVNYQPGQRVRLRVTLEDPGAARWGFSLTARETGNANNAAGTFTVTDAANTRIVAGGGGLQYVTHTAAGTRRGTSGSSSWEVDWTGPQAGGSVTFYVAGNASNNDGQAGSGDRIYTSTLSVVDASPAAVTPRILSQFVFGGGFYTAIYLHNTGASSAAVNVGFFGNDGNPLNVPALGGASTTVNVAAGGIALLEAPNTGSLTQGWARIELPDGVIGYGVFRQSVAGRADQEAVVPLAGASSAKATLIFDDAGLTTAIALANPTSSAVAVTVTARNQSGTALGTATINLPARGKTAFTLASSIAAVAGQRGSVDFTAASGAVSVLGLRFGGEAFTSIPAAER